MILRTPPARKRRAPIDSSPSADGLPPSHDHHHGGGGIVIYEDPETPIHESTHNPSSSNDQMLCTYQCHQMVKSEFIDAYDSKEKQLHDCQSKLDALNDQLCKSEAERKKFQDLYSYAEQELAGARGRETALQNQLMKEVNDSQERITKQLESHSQLEAKFQKEVNLRKNAESSEASATEKASLLEEKLNHLSGSIERERKHLNSELSQFKAESKLSVSRIKADLELMECRASGAEKESQLLKEQLEPIFQLLRFHSISSSISQDGSEKGDPEAPNHDR